MQVSLGEKNHYVGGDTPNPREARYHRYSRVSTATRHPTCSNIASNLECLRKNGSTIFYFLMNMPQDFPYDSSSGIVLTTVI